MSSGPESAKPNSIPTWTCICGFKTDSAVKAVEHINEKHDGKPVKELTRN